MQERRIERERFEMQSKFAREEGKAPPPPPSQSAPQSEGRLKNFEPSQDNPMAAGGGRERR